MAGALSSKSACLTDVEHVVVAFLGQTQGRRRRKINGKTPVFYSRWPRQMAVCRDNRISHERTQGVSLDRYSVLRGPG